MLSLAGPGLTVPEQLPQEMQLSDGLLESLVQFLGLKPSAGTNVPAG